MAPPESWELTTGVWDKEISCAGGGRGRREAESCQRRGSLGGGVRGSVAGRWGWGSVSWKGKKTNHKQGGTQKGHPLLSHTVVWCSDWVWKQTTRAKTTAVSLLTLWSWETYSMSLSSFAVCFAVLNHVSLFCNPTVLCVHGIFQSRTLKWVAISYSRGSSWPRDRTCVSQVSCIGSWILYHCTTWEAHNNSGDVWKSREQTRNLTCPSHYLHLFILKQR